MTTNSTKATPHGQRLRTYRNRAGLSLDEAWADLRGLLPKRFAISKSKLQRMETETPEEEWDGFVIFALSVLYKCRISDLSPQCAAEHEKVGDLLASSLPWMTMCPGQLELAVA